MWRTKSSVIFIPFLYIIVLLFLPILLFSFLPLLIFRRFISFLGQILGGPSLGKILSGAATSHACIRGRGTSLVPWVLQGTPDLDQIKEEFTLKVLHAKDPSGQILYPELKQTVASWGGYLFWKDIPDFQLPIRLLDLAEGVDLGSPSGLALLRSFYGRVWKFGEEPLWEILIIPGLDGSFGFVFTFDHALCDAEGMQKLIDKFSYPSIRPKPKVRMAQPSSRLSNVLLQIGTIFRIPYDSAVFLESFLRMNIFSKQEPCQNGSCKIANSVPNSSLTLNATTFNLPDIKRIAVKHDVSINALLMSSVQGSLQKLWNKEGNSILYFPTPAPNHPEKLRNLGGIGYVEMHRRHENPEERLLHVQDQLQNLQYSTYPLLVSVAGRLSGHMPPFLLRQMINGAAGGRKTFVLSTFIGSRHPFSLCSYPVLRMGSVGSGHAGTRVVSFFAFSCAESMSFTVMGDEGVVNEEEGKALLNQVAQEFAILDNKIESTDHVSITISTGT